MTEPPTKRARTDTGAGLPQLPTEIIRRILAMVPRDRDARSPTAAPIAEMLRDYQGRRDGPVILPLWRKCRWCRSLVNVRLLWSEVNGVRVYRLHVHTDGLCWLCYMRSERYLV